METWLFHAPIHLDGKIRNRVDEWIKQKGGGSNGSPKAIGDGDMEKKDGKRWRLWGNRRQGSHIEISTYWSLWLLSQYPGINSYDLCLVSKCTNQHWRQFIFLILRNISLIKDQCFGMLFQMGGSVWRWLIIISLLVLMKEWWYFWWINKHLWQIVQFVRPWGKAVYNLQTSNTLHSSS